MPRYIAFLRAINVGGHVVKMDKLRSLFTELGLASVETFIASGNVIFESKSTASGALEKKIEKHLESALGYEVATFLRTDAEVCAIGQYKPFSDEEMKQAGTLLVGFLKDAPDRAAVDAVIALRTDTDQFHIHNRELFWLLRGKLTDSKLNYKNFERVIKGPATFRAITTVTRLAAKCPPARIATPVL